MPETINDRVTYALTDQVAHIVLDHAEGLNSLDKPMAEALRLAAAHSAEDAASGAARVVVVRAEGRAFSVGGDLASFADAEDRGAQVKATADDLHDALATLRGLDVPVVSVVSGTAAGGGLGFALVGDIVLIAAEAKLVMAYTASGLTPDCGVSWLVSNRLPWPLAMDLALTNRLITGSEAAAWGLASRAVPADELSATVDAVLSGLAAGPRGAYADTKRLMSQARESDFAEQLDEEAASIAHHMADVDGVEGVDAFLAKRTPQFG